jgi:hypothetical protein
LLNAALAEPPNIRIRDIMVDHCDQILAVGLFGLILRGTPESGFAKVGFRGDDQTLLSVTRYREQVILASDFMLHLFDGHRLTTLRPLVDPATNAGVPVPLRVQGFDDLLIYFDAKHGVSLWNGDGWTKQKMPSALFSRTFDPAQLND